MDGSHPPPAFVFHEFSQPDAAAHDYGPHHEGARQALDETDARIGRILALLDEKDLFASTLFVVTTDHGMACTDTALNGNPARIPERAGMAAVTTEPLIYLRDLRVEIEPSHDGRTARVSVADNDADEHGVHAAVGGAEVLVTDHADGRVALLRTDEHGVAGFAIPGDVRAAQVLLSISAQGFNRRRLRLDGTSIAIDLRAALYGGAG
jgi:hypothetical protein